LILKTIFPENAKEVLMKIGRTDTMMRRLLYGLAVLAFLAMPFASLADYLVDPIAHWKLEEDAANYLDETSNDYDLQCSGPCPAQLLSPDAVVGNGQMFGADNSHFRALRILLSIDQSTTLYNWAYNQDFAIELWFRRDGSVGFNESAEVFIGRSGDDEEDSGLHWWVGMWGPPDDPDNPDNQGKIAALFRADNNEGADQFVTSAKSYNDNQWHHVAVVRDALAGTTTLYVDGVVEDTLTLTYTEAASFSGPEELHLGEIDGAADSEFFEFLGAMDEVAMYNAVLPAEVVYGHYAAGLNQRDYEESFEAIIQATSADVGYVGYDYSLNVLGAGNPLPTYSLTAGPDGMQIDASSGEITWMPNSQQVGDNAVTVEADNGGATPASDSFIIPVSDLCDSATTNYWKLEDVAALADFTLNGKDGSCTSCPTQTTGQVGNALAFDSGSSQFVQIDPDGTEADSIDIPQGQSFSIAAWVNRADGISGNEVVVGRFDSAGMRLWMGINGNDQAVLTLRDIDDGGGTVVTGGTDIADGAWHLLIGVYDAGVGEMRLYVDGVEDGTEPASFSTGFTSASAPLVIGAWTDAGGAPFNGAIDEVAIFKFVLSEDLMAQMVTSVKGYCQVAPTIDTEAPTSVEEGGTYTYQPTASDDDDTVFAWSLENEPDGMTVNPDTGEVNWTPSSGQTTSGAVILFVDDGFGGRDSETFTVTVNLMAPNNQAPVISDQVSNPVSMTADTSLEITLDLLVASDPDNGPGSLQIGTVGSGDNYTVSGTTITPTSGYTGDLSVPVTVTDGADSSAAYALNVRVNAVDAALEIQSQAPTTVDAGETYTYTPSTSRPQAVLTWNLSGAPSGMTVDDSTGVVTWTPADDVTTSGAVTLTVNDPADDTSDSETFTITVNRDSNSDGGGGGGGGGGCFINSVGGGNAMDLLASGLLGSLLALQPRR
jgi:hypothetical protein